MITTGIMSHINTKQWREFSDNAEQKGEQDLVVLPCTSQQRTDIELGMVGVDGVMLKKKRKSKGM